MSSAILEIYDLIESMPVSYVDKNGATVTPTVYNIDNAPNSFQTAQLPCRVLVALGDNGQSMSLDIGPGSEVTAGYTLSDIFLLETVARSEGPYIQSPVLMRYAKAYADAIAQYWQYPSQIENQVLTTTATITPGRFNLPVGSDTWFYGVRCDFTISELF